MRHLRVLGWFIAASLLVLLDQPVQAAWNNVYQVTCWRCRSKSSSPSTSSFFISAAPPVSTSFSSCDPCQTCTTRMVQRTAYQQVTTFESRTVLQPVTTMKTSYFWEPVVTYRTTNFFDPTTCCMKQQTCPVTSYRLRSQCCPVQSFVSRCVTVPVTAFKPVCYLEPQTTCCPAPVTPCCSDGSIPAQQDLGPNSAPGIREERTPGAGTGESREQGGNPYESNRLSPQESIPPTSGLLRRPTYGQTPPPPKAQSAPAQPKVTLDRIAAAPATNVEGDVVANNKNGVRVLFQSADRAGVRQYVTSDDKGHFEASLASGKWLVYTHDSSNRPVLQTKFEVSEKGNSTLTLSAK